MRKLFFCLLALAIFDVAQAQGKFPVSSISPALLKHADVVVRQYELQFKVLNKGEAIETEHKVLTLLNEQGATENDQSFWYNQIRKIERIKGAVYDASGKRVRKIRSKDIRDLKFFESVFVNDDRYKMVSFPKRAYPYTLEYTVVTRHHGLMHYPVFQPQQAPNQSVESADFQVVAPEGLAIRSKEINLKEGQKTGDLHWVFKQLPAFVPESYLPLGHLGLPRVMTAPTEFSIEGYEGDMRSWESFGNFIQKLNAEKSDLSAETVSKLRQLTAHCTDTECKARCVYDYLQKNTRYYFVGLGIGGWQPMRASEVDKFKYSDCKGLSNYTVAMLRAVGVPAYYALIRATESEQKAQTPDFPNPWFNHATLCIPMPNDTLWLECTSQKQSFGFLSDFTDDRPALVIFPEGGKIVQTPRYDESQNTILRNTTIELAADGSAKLQTKGVFRALEQDIPSQLASLPDEQRKKYLYRLLNLSDFEITALSFEQKKDRIPEVTQTLSLNIPSLAAVSGKRLFVPVHFLSSKIELPIVSSPRENPVQANSRGMTEVDTIRIAIPEGYRLENTVPDVSIHSVFGDFDMQVKAGPNEIILQRKLVLNHSIQPKEQFEEFQIFLKNILKADQTKLVLVH